MFLYGLFYGVFDNCQVEGEGKHVPVYYNM